MVKKRDGIRISSNWKLLIIILILIVFLMVLIYFIGKGNKIPNNNNNNNNPGECRNDKDCSPVCGCHPNSCVLVNTKPDCKEMLCSMECSGPLDCGAGYCGCVNGKCNVVASK